MSRYGPAPVVAPGTVRSVEGYGPHRAQVGEWWLPPGVGSTGRLPTVVLLHGGFWRPGFDRSLEGALAADLSSRGLLCWNADYRSSGEPWPATLADVAAAYDCLRRGALADRVDPARTAVVGHSAGGHLALWLAARSRLPAGAPGARTPASAPPPTLVVAQAPVARLADGFREGLGDGAVAALLGGSPAQVPDRYVTADPGALLPTGVPTVLLHAPGDDRVPVAQSRAHASAATAAGDDCRLVEVPGGHFEHLDPASAAVEALRTALRRL